MVLTMKSGFAPLSRWMQEKNSEYYKSGKTSIYSDFLTYAQDGGGLLAKANASEFYSHAAMSDKKYFDVLEVGVGEGAFCAGFLSEIKRQDKKNGTCILDGLKYTLADFSAPMLEKAQKNIKKAGFGASVRNALLDANSVSSPQCGKLSDAAQMLGSYDLIRCNELYSDIPSNAYARHGSEIFEALYDGKMNIQLKQINGLDGGLEEKLILLLPQGYVIPINSSAAGASAFFASHLKEGGWMDIFDYGFYFKDDFSMPTDVWNLSIVREYGTQWTVDLNFLYLSAKLASLGYASETERQADYVQNILRMKLALDDKKGLGYKKASGAKGAAREDDFFYHLRVRNG